MVDELGRPEAASTRQQLKRWRAVAIGSFVLLLGLFFVRFPFQGIVVIVGMVAYLAVLNVYLSIRCPHCGKSFKLSSEWDVRKAFRWTETCANCGVPLPGDRPLRRSKGDTHSFRV